MFRSINFIDRKYVHQIDVALDVVQKQWHDLSSASVVWHFFVCLWMCVGVYTVQCTRARESEFYFFSSATHWIDDLHNLLLFGLINGTFSSFARLNPYNEDSLGITTSTATAAPYHSNRSITLWRKTWPCRNANMRIYFCFHFVSFTLSVCILFINVLLIGQLIFCFAVNLWIFILRYVWRCCSYPLLVRLAPHQPQTHKSVSRQVIKCKYSILIDIFIYIILKSRYWHRDYCTRHISSVSVSHSVVSVAKIEGAYHNVLYVNNNISDTLPIHFHF